MTNRKLAAALAMRQQGQLTMREIAAELGISQARLYRHLAEHRHNERLPDEVRARWRADLEHAVVAAQAAADT